MSKSIERLKTFGLQTVYSCVVKLRNSHGKYEVKEEMVTIDKQEANAEFVGLVISNMDGTGPLVVELKQDNIVMKQFYLNKNLK